MGPLAGVSIVDLTQGIAGPFCGKVLAQLSADVLKVERPGGDPSRRYGPFPDDSPHAEKSGQFLHLNTSKRGITLDASTRVGRALLLALLEPRDVLLESFTPGTMERLGLGPVVLRDRFPSLVITSISNFGQTGPYRDYRSSELVSYAVGGPLQSTGIPERQPIKLGATIVQHQAGLAAALATATSYFGIRNRGTGGDHVDFAISESQAGNQDRRTSQLVAFQHTGQTFTRKHGSISLTGGEKPCMDGHVIIGTPDPQFFDFMKALGREDVREDPRFATAEQRLVRGRADEMEIDYLLPWMLERTKADISGYLQSQRLSCTPVLTLAETLSDPAYCGRGFWQRVEHPIAGPLDHCAPFRLSASPTPPLRPAPRLGKHNVDVYRGELGLSSAEMARLRRLHVI